MNKVYKYRLKLTKAQETRLISWISVCRMIFNLALEIKKESWRKCRKSVSAYDLTKQLKDIRSEYEWVKDCPFDSQADAIKRMDLAYKTFFKGGGFPRWAKRNKYSSITFAELPKFKEGGVFIPKIGKVKVFKDRPCSGEIRRATISVKNGKFYISILTKQERVPMKANESQVGIDMGISFFASLSNGQQISNPRHTLANERKLRIRQRSLARKKKGSGRWKKQKLLVGKMQEKIANQRRDFIHKASTPLVLSNGFIAVEDLNVKGMVRGSKLAKHIADASWGEFFRQLKYKSDWYGRTFVKVNPKYTSQTCNECRAVNKKSRLSQSEFVCVECGHVSNADTNAAKNILGQGLAVFRQRNAIA